MLLVVDGIFRVLTVVTIIFVHHFGNCHVTHHRLTWSVFPREIFAFSTVKYENVLLFLYIPDGFLLYRFIFYVFYLNAIFRD